MLLWVDPVQAVVLVLGETFEKHTCTSMLY